MALNEIVQALLMGVGGFSEAYGKGLQTRQKTQDEYMNDLQGLYLKNLIEEESPSTKARNKLIEAQTDYYGRIPQGGGSAGKTPSRFDIENLSKLKTLRDRVTSLTPNFEKVKTGPIVGRVQSLQGKYPSLLGSSSQPFEQLRSDAAQLKNFILNQLSGAAITEAEAERLAKEIPDENDPPERFQTKYNTTLTKINGLINNKLNMLEAVGYDVSGIRGLVDQQSKPIDDLFSPNTNYNQDDIEVELRRRGLK